jgi:hypothetical protein
MSDLRPVAGRFHRPAGPVTQRRRHGTGEQNGEVDERRLADICDRYGIAELKIFGPASPRHRRAG